MDRLNQALAAVLIEQRARAELTQDGLAKRLDRSPVYISHLERGMKSPTLGVFFDLARGLGVSAADLMRQVESRFTEATPDLSRTIRTRGRPKKAEPRA
jgi:transcriptional regulator with XRE-family HTH domain